MGCFKSKTMNYYNKNMKIGFADKRTQINKLNDTLKIIYSEINNLKIKRVNIYLL
jgi:hypothetical protein